MLQFCCFIHHFVGNGSQVVKVLQIRPQVKSSWTPLCYVIPGPALASAGPDWKFFCGAPLSGVEKIEVMHQGIMIAIGDVKIKKARPERVTPRPLQ